MNRSLFDHIIITVFVFLIFIDDLIAKLYPSVFLKIAEEHTRMSWFFPVVMGVVTLINIHIALSKIAARI